MRIFISKDGDKIHEVAHCSELNISRWKHLVITYLNFQTKPFSKCFEPHEWDTVIINKKVK